MCILLIWHLLAVLVYNLWNGQSRHTQLTKRSIDSIANRKAEQSKPIHWIQTVLYRLYYTADQFTSD